MRARALTPLVKGVSGVARVNTSTVESGGCAAVVGGIAGEFADDTSDGVLEGHAGQQMARANGSRGLLTLRQASGR